MKKMETRSLYDEAYVDRLRKQPDYRIRKLLKFVDLKGTDIVADVGCGDGKLAQLIYDKINKYYGVDFSPLFIASAKRLNTDLRNASFTVGEITDFCDDHKETFDKIFTLDFSEHIDNRSFSEIYSAIYGSMKKNGELIIHTPNRDFIIERLKEVGILKQFAAHIAVRNKEEYLDLLHHIGFVKIRVILLSHYIPILSFLHLFSSLPLIGNLFKARLLIICQK